MNFLTIDEFAQKIKMSPNTIRTAIRKGKIFATRFGSGTRSPYRICETELERIYLESICERKK
jgi:excisionase family DNA binding protein